MDLSWGGYRNGEIPTSKLVAVGKSPVLGVTQYLEAGAAECYFALDAAFLKKFGKHLAVTEGYRDLSRQKQLYYAYQNDPAHNPLAAYFGTSNHGYARAADFGSNTQTAGTPEAEWLREHAHEYGFWPTGYDFARVEPWHYDWHPGTATASLNVTPTTEQEEEDDMLKPKLIKRTEGTAEWSLCAPWLVKPGDKLQQGYIVTEDLDTATAWARLYDRGIGNETATDRDGYVDMQKTARDIRTQWLAAQSAPATTVTYEGSWPTAEQITAAVKAALPKTYTTTAV